MYPRSVLNSTLPILVRSAVASAAFVDLVLAPVVVAEARPPASTAPIVADSSFLFTVWFPLLIVLVLLLRSSG